MSMTEQELAYEAVIELLSHQFANPVKWIDTQDVLLGELECERMVEIGPSNELTVMAKRTLASKYKERDDVFGFRRELLSSETDTIEMQFDEPTPVPVVNPHPQPEASPVSMTMLPSSNQGPFIPVLKIIPDVALSAKTIVVAIVAQKLKKVPEEILDTDTIKSLAGGRSTLENEIVGDLEVEFSTISIPERCEGMEIFDLATRIEAQFLGKLGKKSAAMIERIVGSKMPGSFSLNEARTYLQQRWGLQLGRQDVVLLQAIAMAPQSRFEDVLEVHNFFDNLAKQHLLASGLPVQSQSDDADISIAAAPIDHKALQSISKSQNDLLQQIIKLYARHIGIDMNAGSKSTIATSQILEELRVELAQWNAELGEDYAAGIQSLFDIRKVRFFTSSWAWAIQQVFEVFHRLVAGGVVSEEELRSIPRRANAGVREYLSYLAELCQKEQDKSSSFSIAGETVEFLLKACKNRSVTETKNDTKSTASLSSSFILSKDPSGTWQRDSGATEIFSLSLQQTINTELCLEHRRILITGAGMGSIGSEVLTRLIAAGSRVVVSTSSYSSTTLNFFKDIYIQHSVPGSQLVVVPFNQGSRQDVSDLITWIYDSKGLGWDLDAVIPFAAMSEEGRQIDRIDSKSELAHRIMLTNTIRLIGAIKAAKEQRGYQHRPAQVILPLSVNHGVFGGDGLYAESKIALEALFEKWHSESWKNYLSIAGCAIGWTRGTGLMKANDVLTKEIEHQLKVHTFSQSEMAANIVALLHPDLEKSMDISPMYANFNGGLDEVQNLSRALRDVRNNLKHKQEIEDAIANEDALEYPKSLPISGNIFHQRANIQIHYPRLPDYKNDLRPLENLRDMVNLDSIVVIAGFAELGPLGNSRTRWEMEATGTFSIEGWVEMAWIMGYVKYAASSNSGLMVNSTCWIDGKSGIPVFEDEIEAKYGELILNHSGIRVVEPNLWVNGYNPEKKEFFQEVVVEADLDPFETSEETALAFKKRHGDHVETIGGRVTIRKGATILVPKFIKSSTDVAGQMPTGFDPRTYGISEDIITQVDRVTLYALICTVEALFSAGITDPYEIYKYVHVSEVGNCLGSGVGGMSSLAKMFKGRSMEQDVPQDILQETFINTTAAWVNMLLLSSSGPIRTPVGACATALESLDTAHDLITTGKAKICLVGGVDDLEEHIAYEFANMKATNNSELDVKCGRTPKDMSRPTASDRRGFVESQGAGVQIACMASVALEMGLPIYGIVAFSGTSSDGVSRSVPAPGKGIMVNARERQAKFPPTLLDLEYRRRQMDQALKNIYATTARESELLTDDVSKELRENRIQEIQTFALQEEAQLRLHFGTNFWRQNPQISPLRGSLAVWGLTIDDLTVASFHGTSTVKNELNECEILQGQLKHLGRQPGNRIVGVFQKHLTGHPKGAAAAWMLNGCLQMLDSGTIPGNRNADNVDSQLQQFNHIAFINKTIQTREIKSATVLSFGFGQKGAQAIIVHPKYLLATLDEKHYEEYKCRTLQRRRIANSDFHRRMVGGKIFMAKQDTPYPEKDTTMALVDPEYRAL